jgi:hypothetical protein
MPQSHRAIVGITRKNGNLVAQRKNNLEMLRALGVNEKGTVFADPGFKILPKGLVKFKNVPELTQASITRSMTYNKEAQALGKVFAQVELGLENGQYAPWKITDFISTNPELLKKKIGLDPEAFK